MCLKFDGDVAPRDTNQQQQFHPSPGPVVQRDRAVQSAALSKDIPRRDPLVELVCKLHDVVDSSVDVVRRLLYHVNLGESVLTGEFRMMGKKWQGSTELTESQKNFLGMFLTYMYLRCGAGQDKKPLPLRLRRYNLMSTRSSRSRRGTPDSVSFYCFCLTECHAMCSCLLGWYVRALMVVLVCCLPRHAGDWPWWWGP